MDWQIWHTLMLVAAFLALVATRRDLPALAAIVATQLPYWAGTVAWFAMAQGFIWVNLGADLFAALGFVLAAHMFGPIWLAWLGVLFISATAWDIFALTPINVAFYVELHEIMHYIALAVVVWRNRVVEFSHYIYRRMVGDLAGG